MIFGKVAELNEGTLTCIEPAPKQKWRKNMERLNLMSRVNTVFAASPWIHPTQFRSPIDFLFIDGNHDTRWALVDYHFFTPYVRIGGYIAFHDYYDTHAAGFGVRRAINIILETDADCLKLVGDTKGSTRGCVVFEKLKEYPGLI